ncbi:MAG TPA: sugar phosphate isomerase/epimerase [Bryobacteraceae bacterium]|nr:sugar phosphate isomerase/epimerase [Bryobacteraceae bacterium]
MYSRRDFGKIALAGIPAAALAQVRQIDSKIAGVQIGVQSYSFRDLPLDRALAAIADAGLGECELYAPHVEPRPAPPAPGQSQADARKAAREALRNWRLTVALEEFQQVRKKFNDAGIRIYAYNYSFTDDFTDEEIDRGFQMTQALGAGVVTASSTLSCAKRVAPFAEKYKMAVAYHGHSDTRDPNQFCKPESFAAACAMSPRFAVNLDIGHFTAANYDAVEFIRANHDRIPILHLKDRKRDQGANTPWGQGDTPIKAVLQLLRDNKWPIRAYIEYEYRGASDSLTEVRKCFQYCKEALA